MNNWKVNYSGRECTPVEISFNMSDKPLLTLATDEREFYVEFHNRSDYMAARDSSVAVEVKVLNADKSKYWLGAAVNRKK